MDKISELMDGELDGHGVQRQFARVRDDAGLRHGWDTFHLIGDVMRGERALSQDFEGRLAARLAEEPTVLAPRPRATKRFVAYALSAAASLSAVAVVGWMALFNSPLAPQPELAKAPAAAPAPAVPASIAQLDSVPSEGTMNEYLIAHQEYSPSSDIQGVVPYIRGVSGTRQERGR